MKKREKGRKWILRHKPVDNINLRNFCITPSSVETQTVYVSKYLLTKRCIDFRYRLTNMWESLRRGFNYTARVRFFFFFFPMVTPGGWVSVLTRWNTAVTRSSPALSICNSLSHTWQVNMAAVWNVAPCIPAEIYSRFRGPSRLHHQGEETPRKTAIFKTHRRQNLVFHQALLSVWKLAMKINNHQIRKKVRKICKFERSH